MQPDLVFWDGAPLGPGPIALAIFPDQQGLASGGLGAACSADRSVLIAAEQFQPFVAVHHSVEIVCHGAAALHWLLHEHFHGRDRTALATLWMLSRQSRLIDVAILDQLIRQIRGRDCTRGRSLRELAAEVGVEAPEDDKVRQRVAEAMPNFWLPQHQEALLLALQVVVATRQVYERLASEAENLLSVADQGSRPPSYQHAAIPPEVQEELAAQSRQMIEMILARRALASSDGPGSQQAPPDATEGHPETESEVHARRAFGPLGVGLEAQAAIAAAWLGRQQLQVGGAACWDEVRHAGEDRFRAVSARLYQDREMRALFKWDASADPGGSPLVRRDGAKGQIERAGRPFHTWLRDQVPDELRDVHGCPTQAPFPSEDEPPGDPEYWGPLVDTHPGLRMWRALIRAAEVAGMGATPSAVRVASETVPHLRAVKPPLIAIREIAGRVFRPREGCVFLIGALEDLGARCLVALCRLDGFRRRGTLDCRYFGRQRRQAGVKEPISPIEALVADFLVMVNAPDLDAAEAALRERFQTRMPHQHEPPSGRLQSEPPPAPTAPRSGVNSLIGPNSRRLLLPDADTGAEVEGGEADEDFPFTPTSGEAEEAYVPACEAFEKACERHILLRAENPDMQVLWLRRVRDLLEALPLGLDGDRLRDLLMQQGDWWQEVSAAELDRYVAILSRLATELATFQDLDLFNRLAEQLRRATSTVIVALDDQDTPSQLLHHIRYHRKNELVWRLVGVSRPTRAGGEQLSDEEVATRLLWWTAVTPAGRVVGPDFFAATRRELYLATLDEVMKAVAYAVVSEGYPLVAVDQEHLVLEVPLGQASPDYEQRLSEVIQHAQEGLLGPLAAPCRWERMEIW